MGVRGMFSKFSDGTKPDAVNSEENSKTRWVDWCQMKLNVENCEVLHLDGRE